MNEIKEKFAGIYPATITPFTSDNKINAEAMLTLMRRNLNEGAKGLFIGGSSAECFLLTPEADLRDCIRIKRRDEPDRTCGSYFYGSGY